MKNRNANVNHSKAKQKNACSTRNLASWHPKSICRYTGAIYNADFDDTPARTALHSFPNECTQLNVVFLPLSGLGAHTESKIGSRMMLRDFPSRIHHTQGDVRRGNVASSKATILLPHYTISRPNHAPRHVDVTDYIVGFIAWCCESSCA